jgi:putative hydrolase of the HAD superfamily
VTTTSSINTLFLDIGGVLLTNGWDHTMRQKAAEKFGLDYEEMNERHHLTFDTYEAGKLSLDEYLNRVVFCRERHFTHEVFKEFMFAQSQAYPQMIKLIETLKTRYKLRVAAVSNEGRELTIFRIKKFALETFIDFFVSSCFVHYRKPDPDIFRMALDMAQVSPQHAVYIEDRPMFVEIVRGMGLRAIRHTDYESTRSALAEWGLSVTE